MYIALQSISYNSNMDAIIMSLQGTSHYEGYLSALCLLQLCGGSVSVGAWCWAGQVGLRARQTRLYLSRERVQHVHASRIQFHSEPVSVLQSVYFPFFFPFCVCV